MNHLRLGALVSETEFHFTAAITQENDLYVARCLEVEVTSQGATIEEAITNLQEALGLYFEDLPLPSNLIAPIIAPIAIRA
jgi:predicted RNase H-like HicB family nuclease